MTLPDFAKGASGPSEVYDVSPAGLGLSPVYLGSATASASSSSGGWATGDYKVSAQAADHAEGGAMWLLCDGSAVDAAYADLIALIGSTRPDARGRTLVMKGTNASVSTLLASDGVAVANRRPQHRHTAHSHSYTAPDSPAAGQAGGGPTSEVNAVSSASTGSTDGGSGVSTDSLDAPAFIVPGNLFIHT